MKKKRRRSKSKDKGSAYERAIARTLAAAYYPDGDGVFQRVYSHPIPKKGDVRGDLVALRHFSVPEEEGKALVVDDSWPFSVECKNYRAIKHFFSGLYGKDSEIWEWVDKIVGIAEGSKKMPLLVFRYFQAKDMAVIPSSDFERLSELFGRVGKKYYKLVTKESPERGETSSLVFLLLEDFLGWIDWGFYKTIKKRKYILSLVKTEDVS